MVNKAVGVEHINFSSSELFLPLTSIKKDTEPKNCSMGYALYARKGVSSRIVFSDGSRVADLYLIDL